MLTVIEIVMVVGLFIVPLLTPKKKHNKVVVDTNTSNAQYAIDEGGYIVKL
ncbi:hypothetical protein [Mucilaginibacter paludis]|uniref:Uncharacterized protein n=1 Tax=Mucilaginibacter paludis DSM 18603 TaxID=714943 RepID=H1Y1J4_9SPHI|nr:hypothetical protein [Mucilaginibacter paludis]EHQ30868.1 hypothetical protein Mucpa_6819 [Mucilaginibacter paludis DSM 18603]